MKTQVFIYYGMIYFIFSYRGRIFLMIDPMALFIIYLVMALYAVFLLVRHKTINPLILFIVSLFIPIYSWFDWIDKETYYRPNGVHTIVALALFVFGLFYAKRFQLKRIKN